MKDDPRLESYLAALDRALGPIPAAARAEIVLEIRSHVLDALAREPGQRIDSVLASLGDPESVANRFLLERGLKPGRPPRRPVAKWLTIGFLGTVAMILLAVGFVLFRFQPLVEVDGDQGRIRVLGGLIDVHGDDVEEAEHTLDVDRQTTDAVKVVAVNGKLEIAPSTDARLHWRCRGIQSGAADAAPRRDGRTLLLPLDQVHFGRCSISVPAGLATRIEGANGKILVSRPQGDVDVSLANGKVVLDPDPARLYTYDLKASNGRVDAFPSSSSPEALKVKVTVANGRIVAEKS